MRVNSPLRVNPPSASDTVHTTAPLRLPLQAHPAHPVELPVKAEPAPADISKIPQGAALQEQPFLADPPRLPISGEASPAIFPASWQSASYRAKVAPAPPAAFQSAVDKIQQAEQKYPSDLLNTYVKQIHAVGQLAFFDTPYAGTNSKDKIYIVADHKNDVEKTFHHEVSSILLRRHPENLDTQAWDRSLPRNFHYGNGTVGAYQSGQTNLGLEAENLRDGFLCDYSRSSRENDFNMLAENMFAGNVSFWQAVDRYPKLRAKVELVMDFYQQLSPEFTPAYFQSLKP